MITSNIQSTVSKFCGAITIALGLSLVATHANALTLNRTSGVWSNAVGAGSTEILQTVGTEAQVLWGNPATNAGKSGLGFTGVGASTVLPNSSFLLGTLRHFNNPIFAPAASAVNLDITLDITGLALQTFNFTMNIDETVNSVNPCPYGDTNPCGDLISWNNVFSPTSFQIDGLDYTLQLLGFQVGGVLTENFFSDENATNGANLYAKITQVPTQDVPTPAAILPVLMGMFGAASRMKNPSTQAEDA